MRLHLQLCHRWHIVIPKAINVHTDASVFLMSAPECPYFALFLRYCCIGDHGKYGIGESSNCDYSFDDECGYYCADYGEADEDHPNQHHSADVEQIRTSNAQSTRAQVPTTSADTTRSATTEKMFTSSDSLASLRTEIAETSDADSTRAVTTTNEDTTTVAPTTQMKTIQAGTKLMPTTQMGMTNIPSTAAATTTMKAMRKIERLYSQT